MTTFQIHALRFIGLAVTALVLLLQYNPDAYHEPAKPAIVNGPAAIVEANDCWSGPAPADMEGKVPGHVVIGDVDGVRIAGKHMVDLALRQIFNGEDHGLTVHGFCR